MYVTQTDESLSRVDSSISLKHHDPSIVNPDLDLSKGMHT